MPANVTAFISAKGGSGKTTTASALGTFLSLMGETVVLVDTDASTNGMTLLYMQQLLGHKKSSDFTQNGLFDCPESSVPDSILISDRLILVPATFSMADTDAVDPAAFYKNLKKVIELYGNVDHIILDAQAGSDNFARISTQAADDVVIVSEYDPLSAQGTERLKMLFGNTFDASRTWTLFNKILPDFASLIGDGLAVAKYLPPIPWDADVVRALVRRDLALDIDEPNAYTLSIASISNSLYGDSVGHAIQEWKKRVFKENVDPLSNRIKILTREIDEELQAARKKRLRRNLESNIVAASAAVIGAVVAAATLLNRPSAMEDWGGPVSSVGLASALSACALIAVMGLYFMRTKQRVDAADFRLTRLRHERDRLRASRDAAKSALDSIDRPGFYEDRRRKRAENVARVKK